MKRASRSGVFPAVAVFFLVIGLASAGQSQSQGLHLSKAVMCETVEETVPKNVAVAFSTQVGRVSCFTRFDQIAETTYIRHHWYRRENLVTVKRLTLRPPTWATYSSIQLREADKGPWRVEIWSAEDKLLRVLRFSVVD